MEQELEKLRTDASTDLDAVADTDQLEAFRIKYLGRNGLIGSLMSQLGSVAKEDKPRLGKLANTTKKEIERAYEERQRQLQISATASTIRLYTSRRSRGIGKTNPSI